MQAIRQDMPPLKDLRPYADFCDVLGRDKSTLWRWINTGKKTPAGVIRLNAWDTGRWCTTEAEVRSFITRLSEAKVGGSVRTPATSGAMQKRHKAAMERLAKKGVGVNKSKARARG